MHQNALVDRITSMRKDYEQLFSHLEPPKPPVDLLPKILMRIQQEERSKHIKWHLSFFVALLVGSVVLFIPAFMAVRVAIVKSGFMQYISLLISDSKTVMTFWDSYAMTLLESLPIMSIVSFLATVLVILEALKYIARDLKILITPLKIKA